MRTLQDSRGYLVLRGAASNDQSPSGLAVELHWLLQSASASTIPVTLSSSSSSAGQPVNADAESKEFVRKHLAAPNEVKTTNTTSALAVSMSVEEAYGLLAQLEQVVASIASTQDQ